MSHDFRTLYGKFERVLHHEGLDDFGQVVAGVGKGFDEVPLYSRYEQLSFMGERSDADKNRLLILFGLEYLERLTEYVRRGDDLPEIFFMISVTGWEGWDGSRGLLSVHLWISNRHSPDLRHLRMYSPEGPEAAFVSQAVAARDRYLISEGRSNLPGGPYLARIYIRNRDMRLQGE